LPRPRLARRRRRKQLKRVVNELAGVRAAMAQLAARDGPMQGFDSVVQENLLKLLPALKQIRDKVQDTLIANSKSWEAPNA
jgi:hypothetical protein